jgi:hypothetical protein
MPEKLGKLDAFSLTGGVVSSRESGNEISEERT